MGRPRTSVGHWGSISVTGSKGKYTARARFRDLDGKSRLVEASAETKGKAEARLKDKLTNRQATSSDGKYRAGMTVGAAADIWVPALLEGPLSAQTKDRYVGEVRRSVKGSQVEHLTLSEVNNVGTLESWLRGIVHSRGEGAGKGARAVMSSILSEALRHGALSHNAMGDIRMPTVPQGQPVKKRDREANRAFTREERASLLAALDASERAQRLDIADIFYYLAGTGVRIKEARELRWDQVDLDAGRVRVGGTKSPRSNRDIPLPDWLVDRLRTRLDRLRAEDAAHGIEGRAGTGVVFHSPVTDDREKPRDQANLRKCWREEFNAAGFPWATTHTFRHTMVTWAFEEGADVGKIADHAGHADLRTTLGYVHRGRDTADVASVL